MVEEEKKGGSNNQVQEEKKSGSFNSSIPKNVSLSASKNNSKRLNLSNPTLKNKSDSGMSLSLSSNYNKNPI